MSSPLPFKILSLNVRGLSQEKLIFLRQHVTESNVIGFSESHGKLDLIKTHFSNINWTTINSFFSNASAGVLLAIRSDLNVISQGATTDGLCCWADVDNIRLVCVYLSTHAVSRKQFILNTLMPIVKGKTAIVFGDFNIALNPCDKETPFHSTPDVIQLNDFLNVCDLIDSSKYTEFTFQSAFGKKSRIDYCFISESLSSDVHLETIVLPRPFDHCALKIKWIQTQKRAHSRWIMNSKWLSPLKDEISKKFSSLTQCTSLEWSHFKDFVKRLISDHSRGSSTRLDAQYAVLNNKLLELWQSDPEKQYAEVSHQLFQIELQKAEAVALRARAQFDKFTFAPSAVFTSLLKKRNKENKIFLKHGTSITDDVKIVGSRLASHWNAIHCEKNVAFDNVFISEIPKSPYKIDEPITLDEVTTMIDKLRTKSSPGMDGFVPQFYKEFKNELAPYLAKLFNSILNGDQPAPHNFKTAIIRFIAKKGADTTLPKGWRPISLLNFDLKILTGILAMRLQTVLASLTENVAYIPNRFIIENILNLEAFFKLDLEGQFAFLSDFFNAFDTLNHKWILLVLEKAELGSGFVNAIKFLLCDMVAYPIVGCSPTGDKIDLRAGVRQGDPLSGLLFVLCVEPLIRAAKKLCVKVLAYADDLCFITRSLEETSKLIKLVKSFEFTAGLKLNTAKSKVIEFANPFLHGQIEDILFASSFEYLGYSFNCHGIDSSFLIPKLDKIVEKLNYLKRLNLALSQKVTVLNCYIFSGLFYFLWATSPTVHFFKLCDKIMRWFLGNTKFTFDPSRTYPLHMSLKIFQRPKSHGGFGLISIKAKALAFKWRLFERYRNVDCPFSTLLYSLLKLSRKKQGNVLRDALKLPVAASSFARDLIQTSILLKPTFQATELLDVFTNTSITYPVIPYIPSHPNLNFITTKELSLRLMDAEHPFTLLRKEQKLICSLVPINYDTVWKQIRTLKGLRSSVMSFIYRLFNAGLYLPARCPLCQQDDLSCSTVHFLQCPVIAEAINILSPQSDAFSFLKNPIKATKRSPQLPLLLFAAYAVLMNTHFSKDSHVDYLPRVKMRLDDEIQRRDAFIF
jgi:exonuclease III